jgi:hypothetical protein
MTINNDAFGNYYIGNYISPDQFGGVLSGTNLISLIRTALGSNDRAFYNSSGINFVISWRPNLPSETLTGAITSSPGVGSNPTLPANSRMLLSYTTSSSSIYAKTTVGNSQAAASNFNMSNLFATDKIWATVNAASISIYMQNTDPARHVFLSQGVLENSSLPYPENLYSLFLYNYTTTWRARGDAYTSVVNIAHSFGANANYAHNRLSDGTPTTSEVELYVRDATTNNPYGFIPNVFKWKVDGSEVAPNIGDTVRLNLANATGYYAGQGIIYCKVVGRLGNTTESDGGGDYILMRTFG